MARRKKSLSQKVVGAATTGMPQPVRKVAGSRIGALLIVAAVGLLFASGVVKVHWENGRPQFTVDRHRAAEVQTVVKDEIGEIRDEYGRPNGPQLPAFERPSADRQSFRPLADFREERAAERR